jgi:CAAX prenyl protease-like protein
MLFIGLTQGLDKAHLLPPGVSASYLVYPIQTGVCAVVLAWFWPTYRLRAPRMVLLAVGIGALMFVLWVSPQAVFHRPARLDGFNPTPFASRPLLYWAQLGMRFLRLVIIVPILEEIFWRGFLLRYFIREEFEAVPFGTYTRLSNIVVTIGFMLEHQFADWPAAIVTGLAYNWIAYRTRSLSSCIIAHAATNALLGTYIMATRQWGFW